MNLEKHENETQWEFGLRLIEGKVDRELDLDWDEIVELLELNVHKDSLRKASSVTPYSGVAVAKYYKDKIEKMLIEQSCDGNDEKYKELLLELELKQRELFKERVKIQDVNNSIKREDRVVARWEKAMEALYESIKTLPPIKVEFAEDNRGLNEACILISDIHIGKGVNTPHNKYNLEIVKERLGKLATQVIEYCKIHKVGTLNIDFLGDLVENNLHIDSRVEQVCDLSEQVAYAMEYLSQFITKVSPHFNNVKLHSVSGNHDRLEKQWRDSRDSENYVKLIDKTIELRTGMKFERSKVDDEIEVYSLNNGLKIALQHGHNVKSIDTLVKDVSFYLDTNIDFCHIGHYHTFKSVKGTIVNGSVCGSDKFSNKLRYNDKASQVLAVYYEDGSQVLHNIVLN